MASAAKQRVVHSRSPGGRRLWMLLDGRAGSPPSAGTQWRRHRCASADRAGEQRCQEAGGCARAHCAAAEAARDVLLVISCSLLRAAALALCSAVPAAVCSSGGFVFLICLSPHSSVWFFPASASLAHVHKLIRTHDVAPGIFIHSCYRRSLYVPGTLTSHVQWLSPVSRREGERAGAPRRILLMSGALLDI